MKIAPKFPSIFGSGTYMVTNTKAPINSTYSLNSHHLSKVTSAKYLGVNINHNLSWHEHMHYYHLQ